MESWEHSTSSSGFSLSSVFIFNLESQNVFLMLTSTLGLKSEDVYFTVAKYSTVFHMRGSSTATGQS